MATKYPAQVDTIITLPTVVDNRTPVSGDAINRLRDAILAVQAHLGVKPGSTGTVRSRLDTIDSTIEALAAAIGGGGGGGSLIIQKDNVAIGDGTYLALNFLGEGVTIEDAGSEVANITINGVPPGGSNGKVIYYNEGPVWTILTLDQIAAAYAITLSLTGSSIVETGTLVATPAFTATQNRTPSSAILTDTEGTGPKDVTATPTSFSSDGSFVKNTCGQYVTFTLTANEGGPDKTATATIYWGLKRYWGVSAIPGAYDEAFIEGLASGELALSLSKTFTVTAGLTEKIYYAFPAVWGASPTFLVGGFEGGFSKVATVAVNNESGLQDDYDVWESDNYNLGSTTVGVS